MAIGAILAIAAVGSAVQSRKARKEQRKAEKIQAKSAALQNARARRKEIQRGRRARAAIIAQGGAQGLGAGGSQVAGATGSVQSQTASNVSFLNQLESLDQARFGRLSKARDFESNAQTFQAVGQAAGSFA